MRETFDALQVLDVSGDLVQVVSAVREMSAILLYLPAYALAKTDAYERMVSCHKK